MTKQFKLTGDPAKAATIRARPTRTGQLAGDAIVRSALFQPASYDDAALTIEAVASTFADVVRRDGKGAYLERLDQHGLDTSGLDGSPVLDSHRQGTTRDVIGVITGHRFEENKLIVAVRLSLAEDAQPTIQRIREGSVRGLSVGYRVTEWREAIEEIAGRKARVRTAVKWSIHEASAVAVPADPSARFRSDNMPLDATEDRAGLIARVRAAHNLPEEWATRMAEAEDELTADEIRADGRETALAARAARPALQVRTATGGADDPAVIRDRQIDALSARMMGSAPTDAARPFMQMGLADYARDALTRAGQSVNTLGREEVLTRAMHTTSDFSELLTGAGNRVLMEAYKRAESPLKRIARQRTSSDFRPVSVLKVGNFSALQKVTEAGEIKSLSTGEAKESYRLETFAGIFSLSRVAIVNDDLGAFASWGTMMGAAAAETEASQLLGLLTANAGAGVKLADGKALFHADHRNMLTTVEPGGFSEAALAEARLTMREQKLADGTTPANVNPRFLLVSPWLETEAERLLATINPATSGDVNPFSGRLELLVEPRLTGNAWYLFGDPAAAPVLEYAYLSSAQGPQLSSRDGWEVLGREFRVTLDFGAGAIDHRGAYRHPGA